MTDTTKCYKGFALNEKGELTSACIPARFDGEILLAHTVYSKTETTSAKPELLVQKLGICAFETIENLRDFFRDRSEHDIQVYECEGYNLLISMGTCMPYFHDLIRLLKMGIKSIYCHPWPNGTLMFESIKPITQISNWKGYGDV